MKFARSSSQAVWPDISASLAALMARVGSPMRLAMQLIARAQARTLRREITRLEADVRARFHDLFLRMVAIPATATLLLTRIAERAERQAKRDASSPRTTSRDTSTRAPSIASPSIMRLVATPKPRDSEQPARASSIPRPVPRARRRFAPLQAMLPHPPGGVSAIPLARRLAALEHAIHDPGKTTVRLLKARPELVFDAGWTPTDADVSAIDNPLPRNRAERRADKARAKAFAKHRLKRKPKPARRVPRPHPEAHGAAMRDSKDGREGHKSRNEAPDTS